MAGVLEEHGERLRLADDRQEVRVASPPRHDVLVQMGGDTGPGHGTLVHPQVEAVRGRGRLERPDRVLGQCGELLRLLVGEVDVEGDVAVRADEQMTWVVREQVHHDVAMGAPVDDEPFVVALVGRGAEGTARARLRRSASRRRCRPSDGASTVAGTRRRRARRLAWSSSRRCDVWTLTSGLTSGSASEAPLSLPWSVMARILCRPRSRPGGRVDLRQDGTSRLNGAGPGVCETPGPACFRMPLGGLPLAGTRRGPAGVRATGPGIGGLPPMGR